jgi:mono/diheme cytochrome c family protein
MFSTRTTAAQLASLLLLGLALAEPPPDGAILYRSACAPCHGSTARGDGPDAELFSPPPRDLREGFLHRYAEEALVRRILDGAELPLALDPGRLQRRASEVEDIITHLERLPGIDWDVVERGEELYVDRCERCHGPSGRPDPPPPGPGASPRDLTSLEYQKATSDRELVIAVRHAREGMPPLPRQYSVDDVRALVAYVRILSPGLVLYAQHCMACHGEDGRPTYDPIEELRRPRVVFDRAYFTHRDPEELRRKVWHMLGEHQAQMPHFRGKLGSAQVRAIVEYLRSE